MKAPSLRSQRLQLLIWSSFALGLILRLAGDQGARPSGDGTDAEQDRLSFSNTQKWDPLYLEQTRIEPRHLPENWSSLIKIPPPPANSSPRTRAELAQLTSMQGQRGARRAEIERELSSEGFRFGRLSYGDFTKGGRHPATRRMFAAMDHDLPVVVFTLKKRFDRVRPSILDRNLGHLFPIPDHPAYPSGHAMQAFSAAYLLQELDPGNAKQYLADALRIGRNREVGGFHYPSDTEAGRVAARQFIDLLLADSDFKELVEEARVEW